MALFNTRPRGYKMGFLLILWACAMALFGVVAPGWLRQKLRIYVYEVETYSGLWFYCSSYLSGCDSLDIKDGTGLYFATIALSTSSVVLLLIASLYGLVLNCCASVDTPKRTLQFCSIWAGCKLFVSCMLFVGDNNDHVSSGYASYGPSFIITVVASILAVIGGVLVSANSNPIMPFTSFVVGPNGVTPVQQQFGSPVQPANVYYSGNQVSYTSSVAVSTGYAPSAGYTGPQFGYNATQEVNSAFATQEVKKGF